MKKLILISLVASCFASINAAYDQYGYWRLVNNTDENGNTFLHRLAIDCQNLTEEEFFLKLNQFSDKHRGATTNSIIRNKNGVCAETIARRNGCKSIANIIYGMELGYFQGINDGKISILSDEAAEWYRKHEEIVLRKKKP